MVDFFNKVFNHRFGRFKVGNNAVAQRADSPDVAGGAPKHLFGLGADGPDFFFAVKVFDGDDGRLIEDNPFALNVYQRVRRTEVDGHIGGK